MVVYTLKQRFAKWACDRLTEDGDFGKKNHLFRSSSFWFWRVCEPSKLSHLGHRKPARMHWKADAPKWVTVWCGFLSRGIIGPFLCSLLQVYLLSEFLSEICYDEIAEELFLFSFWCLTWDTNPGFTSNKQTHYLLDYGDYVVTLVYNKIILPCPRPDIETKYEIFLRRFPLSRFLAKTLKANKIAMKSFSKYLSFGVDFKLYAPATYV